MKKINVIVKDKTVLELAEDASKGDIIDLKELTQLDSSYIEAIIDSGKDKVYEAKLEELKKRYEIENKANCDKLSAQIETIKKDNEHSLYLKEQSIKKLSDDKINDLLKQIEVLSATKKSEIDSINAKNAMLVENLKSEALIKYNTLEQDYNSLKDSFEQKLQNQELLIKNQFIERLNEGQIKHKEELALKETEIAKLKAQFELTMNKALQEQKEKHDIELKEKENLINNLQRAKASLNVKQTGEDLESWCDGEMTSYMQNGLLNCTWTKDNKVVKEEGEVKGSKADYIFKVYASPKHDENELLASVCLDMKDENPDSVNKKTNADYYKQLDKNREKKECRYALLVSNLEMEKINLPPIYKVLEYENMYVVRPAYMMTFLNMIASLTTRFRELILANEQKALELKSKNDLLELFEDIKKTYLDKPLEVLQKSVDEILKDSDLIKNAARKIDDQCEKIKKNYISQITDKISRYELKLDRQIVKKLD